MKIDAILWGIGRTAQIFERFINYENVTIVSYTDNNRELWGKGIFLKRYEKPIPIIKPDMIYDYMNENTIIIILSSAYMEIRNQLKKMKIKMEQIIDGYNIINEKYDKRLENILVSNFFERTGGYEIDGFKIDLGKKHFLPQYKKMYLMYDEFFPYLARLEEKIYEKSDKKKHWIIDIGANVGDTILGMIRNTSANLLAVEPTESLYLLLNENIKGLNAQYSRRIKTVQAFISNDENEEFKSMEINGTAVKEPSESAEAPTITIKTLLKMCNIDASDVELIKVDTDGYDADCIMSCEEILNNYAPILYWENEIDNYIQYKKNLQLCEYLSECGYSEYFIFDNYGNYLAHVNNGALKSINGYLSRMIYYWGERTFYYVDVLACKEKQKENVKNIIEQYLKDFPIQRVVPID